MPDDDSAEESRKTQDEGKNRKVSGKLTVFFEGPFWVGVFERVSDGKLSVCKGTFGAEPKDYEVYDLVLKDYDRLRFSPAVATGVKEAGHNPKRVQREVRKQVQNVGIGTRSQQALRLQQEQLKTERRIVLSRFIVSLQKGSKMLGRHFPPFFRCHTHDKNV